MRYNKSMGKASFFIHPSARYAHGVALGLPWLERFSLLEIDSALKLPWHTHHETEVIFCLHGMLRYEFENGTQAVVPMGYHIVIPADTPHRTIEGVDEPNSRLSFFLQKWKDRRNASLSSLTQSDIRRIFAAIGKKTLQPLESSRPLQGAVQQIAATIRADSLPICEEKALLRTIGSAALLYLTNVPIQQPSTPSAPMVESASAWLARHHAEKVSMRQLCAYMGYGHTQLSRLFRQQTGLSPVDWLIRFRIDKAKELLTTTDLPITEVAHRTGFSDSAFFARTFRRRLGLSPSEFRR